MADIRILSGTAWLGFSGFGVKLKVFGQAPDATPVQLGYTQEHQSGNGILGNGSFASTPWYLQTNGIGTYAVWAEHPDNSGVKSNEATYYFDPDNYQGSGDPFDWNGNGIVTQALIVPAKTLSVYGTVVSSSDIDWVHLVVSTSSQCDVTTPNIKTCYSPPNCFDTGKQFSFDSHFALPSNVGSTLYVYVRDHPCPPNGSQSNVVTLTNVSGTDESYNVGTLSIDI